MAPLATLIGLVVMASAVSYWFMFPACIMIAGVVIYAGISGATLLLPLFFLLFPVFGVSALSTSQAVSASLVLQISAFGLGVYRYATKGLVQWAVVRRIGLLSVPAALLGALIAPMVPVQVFRLAFAVGLVAVVPTLVRPRHAPDRGDAELVDSATPADLAAMADPAALPASQLVLAGGLGGLFTGVVSAGVGETTVPVLSRRSLAMPAVAATATVLVAITVGAATLMTAGRLAVESKLHYLAWPVMAWGIPGAILGEELAVRFQGKIADRPVRLLLGALFVVISVGFVALAFR